MDGIRRLRDLVGALAWARHLGKHDRWPRGRVLRYQQQALAKIVRHAARHTPFYAQLYEGIDLSGDVDLPSLPITGKKLLMENFSEAVADSRLTLDSVKEHVGAMEGDEYLFGQYRAVGTTGTSGLRGYFVFDRTAWRIVLANTLRWQRMIGISPRLPFRVRIATIGADTPMHVTDRIPRSGNVGLFKMRHFQATSPLSRIGEGLQEFAPEVILTYPSIGGLLAEEQLAGRLSLGPKVISTHSELLTDEMRARMREAWGVEPFDHYGTTEEPHVGADCAEHQGLHVFEDTTVMEVVDEENQPVPDGTPGAKWLLTNLYNYAQPIIRYEITDILTRELEPCACGRPFARVSSIGGRAEDVLRLPRADGAGEVPIAPLAIEVTIVNFAEVWEYTVRHGPDGVKATVVPRQGAKGQGLRAKIEAALKDMIREAGAVVPPVEVVIADRLPRRPEEMGKVRPVGRQTQPSGSQE